MAERQHGENKAITQLTSLPALYHNLAYLFYVAYTALNSAVRHYDRQKGFKHDNLPIFATIAVLAVIEVSFTALSPKNLLILLLVSLTSVKVNHGDEKP